MCRDCKHTLFSKSDFSRELSDKPRDQRAYENLVQFERGIRLLLPRFQKLLAALQYAHVHKVDATAGAKMYAGTPNALRRRPNCKMPQRLGNV